jgi:hypothetical protein
MKRNESMTWSNDYQSGHIVYRSRSSPLASWIDGSRDFFNHEDGFSINHFPLNTKGDDGGPWILHKVHDTPNPGKLTNATFDGQFCISPKAFPSASLTSDSALDSSGTTAIARSTPTSPASDMAVFLGETMSDGFPAVAGANALKERARIARGAGGEYLNVQFGWLPLVADITAFANAVEHSGQILDQYHRDSGQKIRRAFQFPAVSSTDLQQASNFTPVPAASGLGFLTGHQVTTQHTEMWFKGAFRYHVPVSSGDLLNFERWRSDARKLLGVRMTPEVLWNISPWSWAADWFGSVGDVMHNVSELGTDGLVLQYGYMMKFHDVVTTVEGRTASGAYTSRTLRSVYKQRRPATPYGFGVDLHSLSAKQTAILVALGLSYT